MRPGPVPLSPSGILFSKTTLFKIFETVFPQWCAMLDPKHLLIDGKSSADAPQSWKMGLMGKRFVFCEEPKAGAKFDSALLKGFRGGAPMIKAEIKSKQKDLEQLKEQQGGRSSKRSRK